MDLALYLRVAWRFRIVIASGLVLAFTLAWASYYRLEFNGGRPEVTPREATLWQSNVTLFVTQEGFPWGRSNLSELETGAGGSTVYVPRFADSSRFTTLATLYAELVPSDDVRRVIAEEGPINGSIQARTVPSPDGVGLLPMFEISGISTSSDAARSLASRAALGFRRYLERYQDAEEIAEPDRILVQIVRQPHQATVFSKPSLVRPLFLFLLATFGTVGLVFVLENLLPPRPAPRAATRLAHTAARFDEDVEPEETALRSALNR